MNTVEFKHVNYSHLQRMWQWLDSRDFDGYTLDMSRDFQTRYYTFRNSEEAARFQKRWGRK